MLEVSDKQVFQDHQPYFSLFFFVHYIYYRVLPIQDYDNVGIKEMTWMNVKIEGTNVMEPRGNSACLFSDQRGHASFV